MFSISQYTISYTSTSMQLILLHITLNMPTKYSLAEVMQQSRETITTTQQLIYVQLLQKKKTQFKSVQLPDAPSVSSAFHSLVAAVNE